MILKNKAQCANCKDVIESTHRHDFVACSCFSNTPECTGIFVDGGREYLRSGGNMSNFISLYEWGEGKLQTRPMNDEERLRFYAELAELDFQNRRN